MMGREKDRRQARLVDVEQLVGGPVVPPESFYGKLATWGGKLVTDDQFASLYEPRGRVSVPPSRLAKMLLLMYHDNVSEREAEERTRFDLRWKHVLGLGIGEQVDRLALLRFRARLVTSQKARIAFETFIRVAVEVGLLKADARQVIDSTHVTGAAAVEDTYKLIRHAIRKLLRLVGTRLDYQESWASQLSRNDYAADRKPAIDWQDEAARHQLLHDLVKDARFLLAQTEGLALSEAEKAARELWPPSRSRTSKPTRTARYR